ncbi:TPA: type 1 fimbrial protein [Serratia marcescens]|nr:type 1 fimbrial protein [Serratia marcescens]
MMKNKTLMLKAIAISYLITMAPAYATPSGNITFYGSITEPTCLSSVLNEKFNVDCSKRSDKPESVWELITHTELEYLGTNKNLAIAHIVYR